VGVSFLDYRDYPVIAPLVEHLKARYQDLAREGVAGLDCFAPSPERNIMDPEDVRLYILPARWQRKRVDEAAYGDFKPSASPSRMAVFTRTLWRMTDHPAVVSAMYSCSMPGCELVPHIDNESAIGEVYRLHLGLMCPVGDCALTVAGERRNWANGEVLMFDSARVEHSAHNRTIEPRLILILDLDRKILEANRQAYLQTA